MSEHTKGKWEHWPAMSGIGLAFGVVGDSVGRVFLSSQTEANARRIVACVNALEGISTEAIEDGVIQEALEVLDELCQWHNEKTTKHRYHKANAVLAKLRGEG